MKKESGITLIALVVTIVVLLILAGITITYVLGDGSIFGKASDAKLAQIQAAAGDYISNAQAQALIESYDTTRETAFDEDAALDIMEANFPEGDFVLDLGDLGYDTENHIYTATTGMTITYKGTTEFTVTFENGIAKFAE